MLYGFKLSHNTAEVTKNICYAKDEGAVDHSTVTKWFKKFHSGCKSLINQASSSRIQSMNSMTVLKTIEANPVSSTWRLSAEFKITQSSDFTISQFLQNHPEILNCASCY